jgi:hypothetical protein
MADNKLRALGLENKSVKDMPHEYIDMLYEAFKPKEVANAKEKFVLGLLNKILENVGQDKIDTITKFRIRRDDLIRQVNMDTLLAMEDEIFKHFTKHGVKWYFQKHVNTYILTFLKAVLGDIGFSIKPRQATKTIDGKRKSFLIYTIV